MRTCHGSEEAIVIPKIHSIQIVASDNDTPENSLIVAEQGHVCCTSNSDPKGQPSFGALVQDQCHLITLTYCLSARSTVPLRKLSQEDLPSVQKAQMCALV